MRRRLNPVSPSLYAHQRNYGTISILPTCITDHPDITKKAVIAAREAHEKDKSVLGIHIEGPHLEPERRGAHKADLHSAV